LADEDTCDLCAQLRKAITEERRLRDGVIGHWPGRIARK
jgi:thioredoxin-related protein